MKRHATLLIDILAYISIYPLLLIFLIAGGLACSFAFNLGNRITNNDSPVEAVLVKRLVALPTVQSPNALSPKEDDLVTSENYLPAQEESLPALPEPLPAQIANPSQATGETSEGMVSGPSQENLAQESVSLADSAADLAQPIEADNSVEAVAAAPSPTVTPFPTLDLSFYEGKPYATRTPRPSANPTPEGLLQELVTGLISALDEQPAPPSPSKSLPTLTATSTATDTPTPTATPTSSATATETSTPTITPTFTATPPPTNTPLPTDTPAPTNTPQPAAPPPPTATPPPMPVPLPEYDFLLNEFFNSPTTNSFMVMYVAIVDLNEIPIGDMKIVGTRLDHNLTYESPLSTWYYEGYNAPGHVTKSGNVKFEPPGGIETNSWIFYLADAHGNRMSDDIPFNTNQDDRQWYFVKFKRKY